MSKAAIPPLPKASKGGRPSFLPDSDNERLLTMVVALAGEISVLHDQLDTLARVASAHERFSLTDLETYTPDSAVTAERAAWRKAFLERLFRILAADAERAANPDPLSYADIMALVAGEGHAR
jgi:hypothetical protein